MGDRKNEGAGRGYVPLKEGYQPKHLKKGYKPNGPSGQGTPKPPRGGTGESSGKKDDS